MEEIEVQKNKTITHKNECLRRLDESFDKHINSKELKKVDLLAYWIKEFCEYHDEEKSFDITKIKKYKRGDIIKANLGFNIGGELGGLHYCVVISKNDNNKFNTINIIPLSSIKKDKEYSYSNLIIGNELYELLYEKYNVVIKETRIKLNEFLENKIPSEEKYEKLKSELDYLNKLKKEIDRMKEGSVALIHQITTISKQRIYSPKNNKDILSGIRLSDDTLDKIDEKIKFLFTKIT